VLSLFFFPPDAHEAIHCWIFFFFAPPDYPFFWLSGNSIPVPLLCSSFRFCISPPSSMASFPAFLLSSQRSRPFGGIFSFVLLHIFSPSCFYSNRLICSPSFLFLNSLLAFLSCNTLSVSPCNPWPYPWFLESHLSGLFLDKAHY